MENNLYNLLLRSLDGPISVEERQQLDHVLETSDEVRKMRQEIVDLRTQLHSVRSQTFKPFFTERILERLHDSQQSIADYFVSVFRTVAIGSAVLFVVCTVYNVSSANSFTLESALGFTRPTLEQVLTLEIPFE